MSLQFGLRAALAVTVFTLSTAAWAQPEPTASELLQQAQGHVNQASQLYLQADYEGALAQLKQAEPLAQKAKDPSLANIRFNIARCLEQLKRWPDALKAYEAYNALPDEPHRKERAWEAMQTLKTKVFGSLSVSCFPSGAIISVPGLTQQGGQPCPWQDSAVKGGNYIVSVRHPGYEDFSKEVIVTPGQSINVEASLKAKATVAANPLVAAAPAEPEGPVNIWPWVVGGAGVAALGAGAAFHVLAAGDRDEAEDLPPGTERDDVVDDFKGNRTVALALYGTGGVLTAVGVVLYFMTGGDDASEADAEALRWMPTANGLRVEF